MKSVFKESWNVLLKVQSEILHQKCMSPMYVTMFWMNCFMISGFQIGQNIISAVFGKTNIGKFKKDWANWAKTKRSSSSTEIKFWQLTEWGLHSIKNSKFAGPVSPVYFSFDFFTVFLILWPVSVVWLES